MNHDRADKNITYTTVLLLNVKSSLSVAHKLYLNLTELN